MTQNTLHNKDANRIPLGDERATIIREHDNALALLRRRWHQKNSYYHSKILSYCKFLIPEGSSVLEFGCKTGELIGQLKASYAVGVDYSDEMVKLAKEKYPEVQFVAGNPIHFNSTQKFDYIILSGTLAYVDNIQGFLQKIQSFCRPDTRIVINYYNELWRPIYSLAEVLRLKMPETNFNWLSIDDIKNFLYLSGYQVVRNDYRMLLPIGIPGISWLCNNILAKLPIIRRLSSAHSLVVRPFAPIENADELIVSVVLTCRDEEDNIEGLVHGIPQMGRHTEIIFVEGHSKDNTVGKIQEMMKRYPDKDIKLLKQKGIGQGDAFRLGFDSAQGDFICWLEADLTAPPEEIALFWNAYISGKGEYINGSRFIYQMEKKSMPLFNFLGNRFFGNVFTTLLGQRFTDTLCGFKAISKKGYEKVRRNMDEFGNFDPFGDFQLIFGAVKNGLKVAEVPVHYRPRQYGESKAYGRSFFSFLKHAWLLVKMSWIAFKKFTLF